MARRAGKSTTIDMILGLMRPDAGTDSTLDRLPGKADEQCSSGH